MWSTYYGISAVSLEDAFVGAAGSGLIKKMLAMLDDGVDINSRDSVWKITALGAAASLGKTQIMKILIKRGAKLDLVNGDNLTPLMCACNFGKAKGSQAAMLLIEAGADVTYVRKGDEMTALKVAVSSCTPALLQALIDHGAEVDGPAGTSQTAFMLAARANHVVALEVLLRNGTDPSRKCMLPWANGCTALGLAELEKRRDAIKFLKSLQARKALN